VRWALATAVGLAAFAAAALPENAPIQFSEIAAQAGLHLTSNSSPTGKKNEPETMLAGVAIFD
jgi:hypothetical protein